MEDRTIGVIGVESIKGACYLHTLTIGIEDSTIGVIGVESIKGTCYLQARAIGEEDRNKDHHRHGIQDNRCHWR